MEGTLPVLRMASSMPSLTGSTSQIPFGLRSLTGGMMITTQMRRVYNYLDDFDVAALFAEALITRTPRTPLESQDGPPEIVASALDRKREALCNHA